MNFKMLAPAALLLAMMSVSFALPACGTPQGPPPENPGSVDSGKNVNCGDQLLQDGIGQAIARSNSIIASGPSKTVIEKNLLGLAAQLSVPAVACAVQYLVGKFGSDAASAPSAEVRADYEARREIARDFIKSQGYTFAGVPPN